MADRLIFKRAWLIALGLATAASLVHGAAAAGSVRQDAAPLGLPPLPVPRANKALIALGEKLFFDRRLSFNETMSCGMCHIEAQAFTSNELGASVGMEGKSLRRNAPSLYNVIYEQKLFRDGREASLETQVWSPILSPDEMAAPSVGWVLARINALPDYAPLFTQSFPGRGPTMDTVGLAIAAYEQTLLLANSRFDRWRYGGEPDAMAPKERLGFELFTGKAGCAACHLIGNDSALFTDGKFHDTGLGYATTMGRSGSDFEVRLAAGNFTRRSQDDIRAISSPAVNDLGRFEVTQDPKDRWAFKTPSLRNVALTAPYMHDGSIKSLPDVIDYYDRGGDYSPSKSSLIMPLHLSDAEKQALFAFLVSLTGARQ